MTIQSATPYLILNGHAARALAFYAKALDAQTKVLQRFGDVDGSCPEARRSLVMHAELTIGATRIMMSDGPGEGALPASGIVSIALDISDPTDGRRKFDALAATGKVIQPLFDAPWGSLFGVVVDELGVNWMFDVKKPAMA